MSRAFLHAHLMHDAALGPRGGARLVRGPIMSPNVVAARCHPRRSWRTQVKPADRSHPMHALYGSGPTCCCGALRCSGDLSDGIERMMGACPASPGHSEMVASSGSRSVVVHSVVPVAGMACPVVPVAGMACPVVPAIDAAYFVACLATVVGSDKHFQGVVVSFHHEASVIPLLFHGVSVGPWGVPPGSREVHAPHDGNRLML